ncbi:MAG: hypothetical protein ABIO35_08210 [Nitrobacter sp.]
MSDRTRHPSGRPLDRRVVVGPPRWRIPDKGSVIPRLQEEKRDLHLIGFHHEAVAEARDDDE